MSDTCEHKFESDTPGDERRCIYCSALEGSQTTRRKLHEFEQPEGNFREEQS